MADTEYAGIDLRDADLRHKNLAGKVLFGTDLRGAQLTGLRISLECATFDGVKLDDTQVAMLLLMVSLADVNPEWVDGLRGLVKHVTGDKQFLALERFLRII